MDIEIFKAGKRLDANGNEFDITLADLEQVVTSYNPAFHEAPVVIGHPKMNNPAYAWADKLYLDGDTLKATLKQVDPEFGELVKNGRYKKVSASFYTPDSPNNPSKGQWSLRHIGFLGAMPPAVKGLKEPIFNETDEQGVVDFNEYQTADEEANTQADAGQADTVADNQATSQTDNTQSNETVGENAMSQAQKDELERLKAENAKLKQEKAQAELAAKKKDNASFAEKLIDDGKLAPVAKEKAIALLDGALEQDLAHQEHADFGEAAALLPLVQDFLNAQPKVVNFNEVATDGVSADDDSVDYGENADPDRVELDKKARAYMKQHNVDYVTAIAGVL